MKSQTLKFIVIASLLMVLSLLGGIFYSQNKAADEFQRLSLKPDLIQEIMDAHKRLSLLEAFQPLEGNRDGSFLLNKHIPLDGLGPEPDEVVWWSYIDEDEKNSLKTRWKTEPSIVYDAFGQLRWDCSILADLLNYDKWDPSSSGPYANVLSLPPSVDLAVIPMPNLIGLQYLAKARLAKGLHDKDILPALKEVRHLARLTLGHDSLVDSMIALALLKIELSAFEQAILEGLITETDWTPVKEEDIKLARATIWASIELYTLSQEHTAPTLSTQEAAIERCAVLSEAGFRLSTLKDLAIPPRWPFEYDIFKSLDQFETDWKNSGCALKHIEMYWGKHLNFKESTVSQPFMLRLPYLRMVGFSILASLGPGGYYDEMNLMSD